MKTASKYLHKIYDNSKRIKGYSSDNMALNDMLYLDSLRINIIANGDSNSCIPLYDHYKSINQRVIMSGRTTATITFYCRESKVDRNGFAPIEAVITLNGKRSVISMPRKDKPKIFQRELKKRGENELKEWCDLMRSRLYAVQTELIKHGGAKVFRLDV